MSHRIFELPPALWPDNTPAIQLLCSRQRKTSDTAHLWLKKSFAFTGTPPESFVKLKTVHTFAWHGTLLSDYPATSIVDTKAGFRLQLHGADQILPEITDWDAIHGTNWLIVDDEIMFPAQPSLIGSGTYHMHAIRGQFGTTTSAHKTGSEAWIIRSKDLNPIKTRWHLPGGSAAFKFTIGSQDIGQRQVTVHNFSQAYADPPATPAVGALCINPAGELQTWSGKAWVAAT